MADIFDSFADTPSSPATRAQAVTPHDTNPIADPPKGLYVGGAGNITMRGMNDTADTVWAGVPAGTVLPFRARYVRATGTSATFILALY